MDPDDAPVTARRGPGQDPVLVAGIVVVALVGGWLLLGGAPALDAARAAWVASLLCFAGVAVMSRHTASLAPDVLARAGAAIRPADARRPWNRLAVGAALDVVGCVVQLASARGEQDIPYGPVPTVLFVAASLYVVGALLAFPLPALSRPEWWRLQLDTGTVVVAAGTAAWFAMDAGWRPGASLVTRGLEIGVVVAMAYATARLVLTRRLPRGASVGLLWIVAYAMLATGDSRGATWLSDGRTGWYLATNVVAHGMLFVAVRLGVLQLLAGPGPGPVPGAAGAERGTSWSHLPHDALGASFVVLLLAVVRGDRSDGVVAAVAAFLATGFVVLRHRAALGENQRLLTRLTRTLDERDELAAMMTRMAYEDPLTEVANRARFTEQLRAILDEAARTHTSVAVLLVDLDDFKPVNDRYGHAAGDTVLRECAGRMRACLRDGDLLGRIGGDEFAVVLRQAYKLSATSVGERIVAEIQRPIRIDGGVEARIGASVGIAADATGRRTPDALLQAADAAMYAAKQRGKGTVSVA